MIPIKVNSFFLGILHAQSTQTEVAISFSLFYFFFNFSLSFSELLPAFHELSVFPKKELPFFILFTAGLCSCTALLTLLTHQYPDKMMFFAHTLMNIASLPFRFLKENILP